MDYKDRRPPRRVGGEKGWGGGGWVTGAFKRPIGGGVKGDSLSTSLAGVEGRGSVPLGGAPAPRSRGTLEGSLCSTSSCVFWGLPGPCVCRWKAETVAGSRPLRRGLFNPRRHVRGLRAAAAGRRPPGGPGARGDGHRPRAAAGSKCGGGSAAPENREVPAGS